MANVEATIKTQRTIAEEISRFLRNFKKDGQERKTDEYLKAKSETLEKLWGDFNTLHASLEAQIDKNHPYYTEELYSKTKEIYQTASALISSTEPYIPPQQSQPGQSSTQNINIQANDSEKDPTLDIIQQYAPTTSSPIQYYDANRMNFPKLPPIKIPKFGGDYKEWSTFIDVFTNVIHNNTCLTDVEKMQYLLYHLEGDARRVISHLQLNNNNYNTALTLIRARYNNNRKIITSYINTIIDAKKTEHRSLTDIIILYDTLRECLEALKNLKCDTTTWGPMIVCLATRKLDIESLRLFEESIQDPREMPTIEELLHFLEKRHQVLDYLKASKQKTEITTRTHKSSFHTILKACFLCNKNHHIYQCDTFKKMSVQDRSELITQKKLCQNCLLHPKETTCKSTRLCIYCKKPHHSMIHRSYDSRKSKQTYSSKEDKESITPQQNSTNALSLHVRQQIHTRVLLPTALIRVTNNFGQMEQLRALIDPGSQVSLITEEAVQILKLQKERVKATILGVGETESGRSSSKVAFKLHLKQKGSTLIINAFVLPKLNSYLPEKEINIIDKVNIENLVLADPTFNKPGPVDVILGSDVYASIVQHGLKKGQPTAQKTKLGWILFGTTTDDTQQTTRLSSFLSIAEIEDKLHQFWELEDQPTTSQSHQICESHFNITHTRDNTGRYIVHLPFKDSDTKLGNSRNVALARLIQIEKKLAKNHSQSLKYNEFLREYLHLGHMSPAPKYKGDDAKVYYLPHHAVFKEDSTTTKLRVVFDASCRTDSGTSLNDLLHTGPVIQNKLHEILLRWRKHRYVFTADIEKMFRQIKIANTDKNYQRILWRQNTGEPIQEFVLNTVTYGMGPATFLSVRVLKQLAEDEGTTYPIAKKVLLSDFYIDDMLTGANTKFEADELQKQITTLLSLGGFNLRKWISNDKDLLKNLAKDKIETGILEIDDHDTIKALGIHWNPTQDEFQFKINFKQFRETPTKRLLLSKVASIFDPLGWLAPVTISAKIIMQSLSSLNTGWDQDIPHSIYKEWQKFEDDLRELQQLRIPRWIYYRNGYEFHIHGFCDASDKACAAVVYSSVKDSYGKIHNNILAARTRVAPIHKKTTTPRMELCGALLLTKLIKDTITTLDIRPHKVTAWSDSEVILAWITKDSVKLPAFMSNRVTQIRDLGPNISWKHVSSKENPADSASRGITPKKLINHTIWWKGPLWLAHGPESWPSQKSFITSNVAVVAKTTVESSPPFSEELITCSSLTRQIRVLAYCWRFINNCRLPEPFKNKDHLQTEELDNSHLSIIKLVQGEAFKEEIKTLRNKKQLKSTSRILSLHPFLDEKKILRVGGRLQNSNLPEDAKHQILLPQKHHLTNLIIHHAHQQTLHGGTQLTLNYVRSKYWIINAKSLIQKRLHKCITCVRHSASTSQQLMGNLPSTRILPSPPFSSSGVDYAGPFLTKMSKGRGTRTLKGYIALFICMTTKAVHLELVSDLTADAFLAAYKRFVARRGNCKEIYSDNGTNFVGAHNKLDKELQEAIKQSTKQAAELTANDGTTWKFLPPASPHLGGLWEAGIKSVKKHLKRILGETILTFEEFTTVLYQVEACLNSRPIGQLSADPRDLEPLTPGHFLIGRPMLAPPEPTISEKLPTQRWKLLTKFQQHIWKRWSEEYLNTLQQRSKWKTEGNQPRINELVLIKDDTLPPQKWSLGRITELHPGTDNLTRIVSVQCKAGIKKRPLNKLCRLLITHTSISDDDPEASSTTTFTTIRQKPIKRQYVDKPQKESTSEPEQDEADKRTPCKEPTRKKIRIAPCTWAAKFLSTAALLLFLMTIIHAQGFKTYHPKSGLYIENLGHTRIKRGTLRLQLSITLDELLNDTAKINKTWDQMNEVCAKTKRLTQITHCDNLLQHLHLKQQGLTSAIAEITQQFLSSQRKKRGILGNLLTTIFGVNDRVYTEIENIQHSQRDFIHAANQQAMFLNTKINQTAFILEDKLKQLDLRLNKVTDSLNHMSAWYRITDHNRIAIEVLATYISAEDFYNELTTKYQNWLRAMHGHGHILNFISTDDIKDAIERVTEKLPNLIIQGIPGNKLETAVQNETLDCYAFLNILEVSTYELIHITTVPQRTKNNTFLITQLPYNTIAVNLELQTYFPLEEEDLKSCEKSGNNTYLCSPSIIHSIEDDPCCIIDQIYERHTSLECESRHVQLVGTIWKSLIMKNTWLYITTIPKPASVICKTFRKELLLNNTGIIHLEDGCSLKTRGIKLLTSISQRFNVISSHIKEIQPTDAALAATAEAPAVLQTGLLISSNKEILSYTSQPPLLMDILHKSVATNSAITSSTIAAIILLIGLSAHCYIRRRKRFVPRTESTKAAEPVTRRRSTPEISQSFARVLHAVGGENVHT